LEAVEWRVVRVLFQNPDSLWAALRVERKDDRETITVVGEFMSVSPEDRFLFTGEWVRHPKWGLQLKATTAERVQPHTPDAIIAFLSGGLFPGIGLKLARRLAQVSGLRIRRYRLYPAQAGTGG
jgi:exodeoxyribonuclease V alpha subunit